MLFARPTRRLVAPLALATVLVRSAPALCVALALVLAAPPALAQADGYKQHMENGVKLYADRNFEAAAVEFRAAYEARPSANPLVNIALCEKALFRYPKAIEALELALSKHAGSMDAADVKASEDAIREMRGLLGFLTVTVSPAQATVIVDGDEQPAGSRIPLGPGVHQIEARADGYASDRREVKLASTESREVAFNLDPDKGHVSISAPAPTMAIFVDERPVGIGSWKGYLPPGPHDFRLAAPGGAPLEAEFLVVLGKELDLVVGPSGGLVNRANPNDPMRDPPRNKPTEPRVHGLYGFLMSSILFPVTFPPAFPEPKTNFGAGYGARVGYRVNHFAGFEATYEHSSLSIGTKLPAAIDAHYRIISDRMAVGLRFMSPTRVVRAVGSFGAGLVIDGLQFYDSNNGSAAFQRACRTDALPCPFPPKGSANANNSATGLDAFGLLEAAAEFDIDSVLIDIGLEVQFHSTGNISYDVHQHNEEIYRGVPLINVGPALRVGYRFW